MMVIGTTENFLYGINPGIIVGRGPVGDALARVMALAATCEADFQKLRTLFAVPGSFGPTNRVSVSIDTSIAAKNSKDGTMGTSMATAGARSRLFPLPATQMPTLPYAPCSRRKCRQSS